MCSAPKCQRRKKTCFKMQGFLRAAILLILSKGESYGYTLQREIISNGLRKQVDMGSIYKNLRMLEEAGLVKSEWQDSEVGPEKRVYILTEKGLGCLQQWKSILLEKRQLIDTFISLYEESTLNH